MTSVQNAVICKRFVSKYCLLKQTNIYTIKYMCYILLKFTQTQEKP